MKSMTKMQGYQIGLLFIASVSIFIIGLHLLENGNKIDPNLIAVVFISAAGFGILGFVYGERRGEEKFRGRDPIPFNELCWGRYELVDKKNQLVELDLLVDLFSSKEKLKSSLPKESRCVKLIKDPDDKDEWRWVSDFPAKALNELLEPQMESQKKFIVKRKKGAEENIIILVTHKEEVIS